jgi:sugar phosphate permease
MGLDLITVGTMTSLYSLARAITKVGAGFATDNYSPRYLLTITVFLVCANVLLLLGG